MCSEHMTFYLVTQYPSPDFMTDSPIMFNSFWEMEGVGLSQFEGKC